ncbi:MAG TPA: hypothetical protein VK163_11825 [Opitutaceae bacterium]|nr:hypothetical protein [Opitutaceae bacterium]
MQVAFFPPPAAAPNPAAAPAADAGAPAGDAADASFASLLDSNAGQSSPDSAPSPSFGDTAVVNDAGVAQPAFRKPAAAAAPDLLSVPEFLTAAAAMLDLPVVVAAPIDAGAEARVVCDGNLATAAIQAEAPAQEEESLPVVPAANADPASLVAAPVHFPREMPTTGHSENAASDACPAPFHAAADISPSISPDAPAVLVQHPVPAEGAFFPDARPESRASFVPAGGPAVGQPAELPAGEAAAQGTEVREPSQNAESHPVHPAEPHSPIGTAPVLESPDSPRSQTLDLSSGRDGTAAPAAHTAGEALNTLLASGGGEVVVTHPRAAVAPLDSLRLATGPQTQGVSAPSFTNVRSAESRSAEPTNEMVPLAPDAAATREPTTGHQPSVVTAVRTLAQVLVENTPAAQKPPQMKVQPSSAPNTQTPVSTVASEPVASAVEESANGVQLTAPLPQASDKAASADAPSSTANKSHALAVASTSDGTQEAITTADSQVGRRKQPEILAAGRARNSRAAAEIEQTSRGKNTLGIDAHGVERSDRGLGTGIAKETQPMSVHTPVLPPVSAALDSNEPAAASVSTAQTATIPSTKPSGETHALRSHAVELVRETLEVAERAQAAGRNQVELRLPSDDGDLRVRLSWHDGVVHTKFVTHDVDLQQALSREWEHAAPKLAEKGLKFGEPSFENRDQSGQSAAQNASDFDQQRHSSRGRSQDGSERAPEFTLRPSASSTTASVRRTAHSAATAAVAPGKSTLAETRGLRAWA